MRKSLVLFGVAVLISAQAFATYFIVMKDGSQLRAKAKWTVVGGKAVIQLENGQSMAIDPNSIDAAKSEEVTRMGGGSVLGVEQQQLPSQKQKSSLGAAIKLRKLGTEQTTTTPAVAPTPVVPSGGAQLSSEVAGKFERAFENVGIFEHRLAGTNRNVRAEVTADNEDKVFNAISATAFLVAHNAGMDNMKIDVVELFMRTTTGGAAGRFQMSRADAEAINGKTLSLQDYFVRKVIY